MGNDTTVVIDFNNIDSNSPAGERPAALLIVGGELNGTLYDLTTETISIGRHPDNTIPLEFQGVSRHHCLIQQSEDAPDVYTVQDTGSKNGTFLNNNKVEKPTPLKKGDTIKIGPIVLKYLPKGDPERITFDKLREEANTDGLTKCFNKSYFNNSITLEVNRSKSNGAPLTLLLFDLDHFKSLNDNYGHDAGDYVLQELAKIIKGNGVRDKDVFARYGGEEFVILLPRTNLKQGFEIAERLRKLIAGHQFMYDNKKLPVTASIGVADYRQGVLSGTDLFKRADSALYKAKENGRNQVQFYRE